MIEKDMEKINFNNEMSETLAVTVREARGGHYLNALNHFSVK